MYLKSDTSLLAEAIAEASGRRAWLAPPVPPEDEAVEPVGALRGLALALQARGRKLSFQLSGLYDAIAVSWSPNKKLTLARIARAFLHLREGGTLWFAAMNNRGAKSYAKRLRLLGPTEETAKRHARLVGVVRTSDEEALAEAWRWIEEARTRFFPELGVWSRPGIFAWNRKDPGSALLVETLGKAPAGEGMELGCGNGWTSVHLRPRFVHLVEADRDALSLASRNLHLHGIPHEAHWLDVEQEPLPKVDWVISNPPYHEAGASRVDLGARFIEAAVQALKRGGEAWIVTGRRLPYEHTLKGLGVRWEIVRERGAYKVFRIRV